jgi:(2Fe-2S) ferredoxin
MSRLKKLSAHALVCTHKTCRKQGGRRAARELKHALKEHKLRGRVLLSKVGCLGQCGRGPVVVIYPAGIWYGGVDQDCARKIVEQHLIEGRVVEKNLLHDMRDQKLRGA